MRTKYATIFDVLPFLPLTASVAFTSAFASRLSGAIVNSSNADAAEVVKALGYRFLNGVFAEGQLFNAGTKLGVWLAGTFLAGGPGAWPAARIPSDNDGLAAQVTTCIDMAKLYALIDLRASGASSPVSPPDFLHSFACNEMLTLLAQAQTVGPDPSFLTRSEVLAGSSLSYAATHTKIGLGPLKVGGDIASEGTFLRHSPSGKRYLVVFQNSSNRTASLKALSLIVDKTIRLDLGLP